ncbi:hypothetical protein E3U23_06960 [Erythrobacter litoralis]|uniref:hypothetical protein n=1 Tax=Erythrobacter litoralis TaxID=39960 RepID=UPI0024358500|nr:hypothetical protein [Erythrobacter litoralis]MDG6078930.1 hypothetical protein [Erythrobacter litoralis]
MSGDLQAAILILVAIMLGFVTSQLFFRVRNNFAASYRIAMLGLPLSGKTALVTAIFEYIFSSSAGRAFAPVGEKTIKSINQQISLIESRKTFDRTRDQDIFLFRFLYYVKSFFLPFLTTKYEGEVVDFPGEMSHRLFESSRDGDLSDDIEIFDRDFYTWIISSKAHIFTVDLAGYLATEDKRSFASARSSEIRRTWQILSEKVFSEKGKQKSRVALVFTKADLAFVRKIDADLMAEGQSETMQVLWHFRYETIPSSAEINFDRKELLWGISTETENYFKPLIDYFSNQDCEFRIFYCSSYKDNNEKRLGIEDLTRFLLPKSNVF